MQTMLKKVIVTGCAVTVTGVLLAGCVPRAAQNQESLYPSNTPAVREMSSPSVYASPVMDDYGTTGTDPSTTTQSDDLETLSKDASTTTLDTESFQ